MCNLVIVCARIQLQNMMTPLSLHRYSNCCIHSRSGILSSNDPLSDISTPFEVRAEVTSDNTSIRVSWQWSRQGLLTCVDVVTVRYQPEGGSLMMYTVSNTTATSTTLPNLQCNTKYTIWVYVQSGLSNRTSVSSMISLPARGRYTFFNLPYS